MLASGPPSHTGFSRVAKALPSGFSLIHLPHATPTHKTGKKSPLGIGIGVGIVPDWNDFVLSPGSLKNSLNKCEVLKISSQNGFAATFQPLVEDGCIDPAEIG
jgi:hypothetical protein